MMRVLLPAMGVAGQETALYRKSLTVFHSFSPPSGSLPEPCPCSSSTVTDPQIRDPHSLLLCLHCDEFVAPVSQ